MENYAAIVLPEKGWIIEKLVTEITNRLPYTRAVSKADPGALLNYYVTYAQWERRVSSIEVGYFTHIEPGENEQKFYDVAHKVDYCICHSEFYKKILESKGVVNVSTINPGVDLSLFRPKLQIGVVGRTYPTGRKGEGIVAQLMDIEWIDWHFTGSGWPGPALNLSSEELASFYRKMDYILVPALYEGGPMCVAEAIASGTEVIAPPIGWVPQFEHIEFETGNASSLRKVLERLYSKKKSRADKVQSLTWDNWAEGHDIIFRKLAKNAGRTFSVRQRKQATSVNAAIMFHTDEKRLKGGPAVRVPQTANYLKEWCGFNTTLCSRGEPVPLASQIVHVFATAGATATACVETAYRNGIPCVLSPIFQEGSVSRYYEPIRRIFNTFYNDQDTMVRLKDTVGGITKHLTDGSYKRELSPQDFFHLQNLYDKCAHIIFLSTYERELALTYGLKFDASSIVHNPVDTTLFSNADPDIFRAEYGVSDYLLCVGRLEDRKNQLLLAYALKDTDIPVFLVGHIHSQEYLDLVLKHGGKNVRHIGRLPASSPLLASAYAGARVWCLPSWSEGASLSNLEAAAAGCNMVVSNRSSEKEYFGEFARYCDPASIESIRSAVMDAWDSPLPRSVIKAQKEYIQSNYSWGNYIQRTADVYRSVLAEWNTKPKQIPIQPLNTIYIDITKSMNRSGPVTGMARVELGYAKTLNELLGATVKMVVWSRKWRTFVPVSPDSEEQIGNFTDFESLPDKAMANNPSMSFKQGSTILSIGGEWLGTEEYAVDLRRAVTGASLKLFLFVHDMIPVKFSHWFPNKVVRRFKNHFYILLDVTAALVSVSENTARDITTYLAAEKTPIPPIRVVPSGASTPADLKGLSPDLTPIIEVIGNKSFVLCVSGLDIRKNHQLLYSVWRRFVENGIEPPHLICVGKKQWNIDHFLEILHADDEVSEYFHIFSGLNDSVLNWLYTNCLFTVYPSLYEGWGLPVEESLAYGKVCLASNAGAIPEIAGNLAELIDPLDFAEWYSSIYNLAFNATLLNYREEKIKDYTPRTWKDAATQLLKTCIVDNGISAPGWPSFPIGFPPEYIKYRSSLKYFTCGDVVLNSNVIEARGIDIVTIQSTLNLPGCRIQCSI